MSLFSKKNAHTLQYDSSNVNDRKARFELPNFATGKRDFEVWTAEVDEFRPSRPGA
jgi:hypothetical protein